MKLFTESIIAWGAIALFALSLLPYILKTWNLHTNPYLKLIFKILFKFHNEIGYLSLVVAFLHALGWFWVYKLTTIFWFGSIGLLLSFIATIFGYLYFKDKSKTILIIAHGILFTLACILISIHVTMKI